MRICLLCLPSLSADVSLCLLFSSFRSVGFYSFVVPILFFSVPFLFFYKKTSSGVIVYFFISFSSFFYFFPLLFPALACSSMREVTKFPLLVMLRQRELESFLKSEVRTRFSGRGSVELFSIRWSRKHKRAALRKRKRVKKRTGVSKRNSRQMQL